MLRIDRSIKLSKVKDWKIRALGKISNVQHEESKFRDLGTKVTEFRINRSNVKGQSSKCQSFGSNGKGQRWGIKVQGPM